MLKPFANQDSVYRLLEPVQRAPSVHNTQPWYFRIAAEDRIDICARFGDGADALRRAGSDVANPIQVEGCGDYGGDLIAVLDHRERGHQARNAVDPSDEIVAQREVV